MDKSNGYAKWNILIWIFGILIGVLYFIGDNVIANERENKKEHTTMAKAMNEYIIPMKESIARIEVRLGTMDERELSRLR